MEIAASQYGTTFHSVFAVTRWNTLSINSATLSNSNNPQQVIRINEKSDESEFWFMILDPLKDREITEVSLLQGYPLSLANSKTSYANSIVA